MAKGSRGRRRSRRGRSRSWLVGLNFSIKLTVIGRVSQEILTKSSQETFTRSLLLKISPKCKYG
jgi:hypothetical protein